MDLKGVDAGLDALCDVQLEHAIGGADGSPVREDITDCC